MNRDYLYLPVTLAFLILAGLASLACLSSIAAGSPGCSLDFSTTPPNASVVIDGIPAGTTPETLGYISPGPHTFALELEGYESINGSFTLQAGEKKEISYILTPSPAAPGLLPFVIPDTPEEKPVNPPKPCGLLAALVISVALVFLVLETGELTPFKLSIIRFFGFVAVCTTTLYILA